ncbi:aldehyde ferredoxin oxidoreductase family protein [Desulfosarcina ovata]|uniref:Aldehyde ferredoxin oxidoreductase n=1 Tax=Desulfosarcina ovata subsp. ovata TaxID=2752305 RepID=A0A5K8A451_9BACT|nr:aldehyde ferredoxin oxidoreductase family protein [Desulfosarcina ovata]BBO87322.1 aldehyde ferredoxin oxidoreductase [Desulfosarcina ovata subsp. ovata]
MSTIVGTSNRIIEINLSTSEIDEFEVTENDRRQYLGGKGLGLKLLYERIQQGAEPLGEENWLAFMMGVLMGTGAPCSGRFSVVTKSPLTGIMLSASCGGPFGMAYKTAGYDGLLITGKATSPVVVVVDEDGARISNGSHLWGLNTQDTQQRVNPEGKAGVLAIGPAGENGVRFANVASGHRFVGRGGVGAVMGAKNLKAIVARGKHCKIVPADPKRFVKAKKRASAYIARNPTTADDYRHFGTASHVKWCNAAGILPVRNFSRGSHPQADQVSGETMRQRYNSRPRTCKPCSIMCGHKGTLPDGTTCQVPEYESLGLLGPNLGIFEPDAIARLNERCGLLGLDTISAGAVLAWCMEAGEKGLIQTELKFGSVDGLHQALDDMAHRNGWGDQMADGTRCLAERYGGSDFAIHVKGLEVPAYDPRGSWGQGLAYAVANRGACHLSAGMFALEVTFGLLDPYTPRGKARFVRFFENLYAAVNSLVTCQFTAFAYTLEPPVVKYTPAWLLRWIMRYLPWLAIGLTDVSVYSALWRSVTGEKLNQWQLLSAGARIHVLERLMNTGDGISRKDDTLPQRMLTQARGDDPEGRTVPLQSMLDDYYRLRGYDLLGIPTKKILSRLGIEPKWERHTDSRIAHFKLTRPKGKRLKRLYLSVLFWFVGRAVEAGPRVDRDVRQICAALPEGLTFSLGVAPDGPAMIVGKDRRGKIRYWGGDTTDRLIDVKLTIKNIEAAMLLFTFREATTTAVARNRLIVDGDIGIACSVVRILDVVETFLLPKALARLAVRRYPNWSPLRKYGGRILIYLRAVLGV